MPEDRIAVYTAIIGYYDKLDDPEFVSDKCDYFCLTNNKNLKSRVWQVVYVDRLFDSDVLTARHIKLFPYLYLKDYRYSLWVDGNITINCDIGKKFFSLLGDNFISVRRHLRRNCIYEESRQCYFKGKERYGSIFNIIKLIIEDGYPKNNGLCETNILLRDASNNRLPILMDKWWNLIYHYSKRDQLSFNYIVWKMKYDYGELFIDFKDDNPLFKIKSHMTYPGYSILNKTSFYYRKLFYYAYLSRFSNI